MKKTIKLMLLAATAAFLLCGCGESNEGGSSGNSSEKSSNVSAEPTGKTTDAPTGATTEPAPTDEPTTAPKTPTPKPVLRDGLLINVMDVGKGDAILVSLDGRHMLIDAGYSSDRKYIKTFLENMGVEKLDRFVITHFDKDHVGSAAYIAKNFEIDEILYPDYEGTREEYEDFMEQISGHKNAGAVTKNKELEFGNCTLMIYPALDKEEIFEKKEPDNDMSLVMKLTYGEKSFLFTGDIEKTRIAQMLDSDIDLDCDWIKMPHHGKYQKILCSLLDECTPDYAVITDSYSDPAEEKTLNYLNKIGAEVYETINMEIETWSDGKTIEISTKNSR